MPAKSILSIVPTVQAAQLLGENVALAKKKDKTVKDFLGMSAKNIVGTEIIKLESGIIATL